MMTFDTIFVVKKLEEIKTYREETRELFQASDDAILNNKEKLHAAERLLQLLVDTVIDINQHIIKEQNLEIKDDLQSAFYTLADNNILPKDFAEKIAHFFTRKA